MAHLELQDYIIPFPTTSRGANNVLASHGVLADIIAIDAAHEYKDVVEDMEIWWALVRDGGLLLGDDYSALWPGVMQAVNEFAEKNRLHLHTDVEKWWLFKPHREEGTGHVVQ